MTGLAEYATATATPGPPSGGVAGVVGGWWQRSDGGGGLPIDRRRSRRRGGGCRRMRRGFRGMAIRSARHPSFPTALSRELSR